MDSRPSLQVKKLKETARLPQKGSAYAAGYDLYSAEDGVVPAQGKALIKTGIAIAVPTGNYGRVAPRSGLAWKHFIDTGAGVIDEDYRGEVGVVLFNHAKNDFEVKIGDRIAQLIIEKITETECVEVSELSETSRGAGGFGSTGVSESIKSNGNGTNTMQPEIQSNKLVSVLEKRKAPEGGFLTKDLLEQGNIDLGQDEAEWKEWCILVLYGLCQEEFISVQEKKSYAKFVLDGNTKAYKYIRDYTQGGDLTLLKSNLSSL